MGWGYKEKELKNLIEEGKVIERYAPTTTPDKIAGDIEKTL